MLKQYEGVCVYGALHIYLLSESVTSFSLRSCGIVPLVGHPLCFLCRVSDSRDWFWHDCIILQALVRVNQTVSPAPFLCSEG